MAGCGGQLDPIVAVVCFCLAQVTAFKRFGILSEGSESLGMYSRQRVGGGTKVGTWRAKWRNRRSGFAGILDWPVNGVRSS